MQNDLSEAFCLFLFGGVEMDAYFYVVIWKWLEFGDGDDVEGVILELQNLPKSVGFTLR